MHMGNAYLQDGKENENNRPYPMEQERLKGKIFQYDIIKNNIF